MFGFRAKKLCPRRPSLPESEIVHPSEMIAIGDGFVGNNGILQDGVFLCGE